MPLIWDSQFAEVIKDIHVTLETQNQTFGHINRTIEDHNKLFQLILDQIARLQKNMIELQKIIDRGYQI